MAKKQKVQTLMTAALNNVATGGSDEELAAITAALIPQKTAIVVASPVPAEPWYKTTLRPYVKNGEEFTFVCEQIENALNWGGDNHMVKFPQDALLALLKAVHDSNTLQPAGIPAA